jgi:predicted nucleotidyltransferase
MVSTKADVLELLDKNKTKLNKFGVRKFSLFGSFLFDQATAESDVDLLVKFEPDKNTFTNFSNLAFFLEQLFGRRVEIVTIESLSPYIGPHILREVERVTISA